MGGTASLGFAASCLVVSAGARASIVAFRTSPRPRFTAQNGGVTDTVGRARCERGSSRQLVILALDRFRIPACCLSALSER
jgi:hypothetical protein